MPFSTRVLAEEFIVQSVGVMGLFVAARPAAQMGVVPGVAAAACPVPERGGQRGPRVLEPCCSLLHSGAGDVATFLSVGNEFPDPQLALEAGTWSPGLRRPDDPDEIDALWDQVGHAGQWDLCMQALHAQPARQWRPGRGYVFGDFILKPETGLARAGAPAP